MNQEVVSNKAKGNLKSVKKFLKVLGNIVFAVLLLIMVMLVFFLIKSKVSNRAPSIAGCKMYVVMSGSMNPTFNTGSLVIEKQVNNSRLNVGDIITFIPSKNVNVSVTHRIIKINIGNKVSYTTKGDANKVNDPETIYPENILGKVMFSIPYVGYLMYFVRTKIGTMFLIIVPCALIMLYEIKNLFLTAMEHEKEKVPKNETLNK